RTCRVVWTFNANASHVREEGEALDATGLDGGAKEGFVQVVHRREIRRKEGHADRVRSGLRRKLQIDGARFARSARRLNAAIPVEEADAFTIQTHFEFLATNTAECAGAAHV